MALCVAERGPLVVAKPELPEALQAKGGSERSSVLSASRSGRLQAVSAVRRAFLRGVSVYGSDRLIWFSGRPSVSKGGLLF